MRIVKRTAVYRYRNEKDRLLFERVRYRTDQPAPRHKVVTYQYGIGGNWSTGYGVGSGVIIREKHPDADRYLYRLPELLQAVADEDDIWWTEGESDADAVVGEGRIATSHHGGAGRATIDQSEWFRGHKGRVVLPYDLDDDDKKGGNVGAHDVVRRYNLLLGVGIHKEQIFICHAKVGKDIRDHIEDGLPLDSVVFIRDIEPLLGKSVRTMGSSFFGIGYAPPDTELLELIDANPNWNTGVPNGKG